MLVVKEEIVALDDSKTKDHDKQFKKVVPKKKQSKRRTAPEGEPPVLAKAPFTQMTAGEPRRCHREHCVPHVPHTQHASRVQVGPAALSPRARPIAAGGQHAQAAREADRLHRAAAD